MRQREEERKRAREKKSEKERETMSEQNGMAVTEMVDDRSEPNIKNELKHGMKNREALKNGLEIL